MKLRMLIDGVVHTLFSLEGSGSASEFLSKLENDNPDEHARMWRRLVQLADRGASHRKDEFRDLGKGLFEAKTIHGARVFFFYDEEVRGVVLCAGGFLKQKQKTPRHELTAARDRKKEYETRHKRNEKTQIYIFEDQKNPGRLPK